MNKLNKRKKPILLVYVLLLIIICYISFIYLTCFKIMSFHKCNNINEKNINIVVEDKLENIKNYPLIINEEIFLPLDFVEKFIDNNICWENSSNKLIITTLDKLIIFKLDSNIYKINYKQKFLETPIKKFNNIVYIPVNILKEFYNINIKYEKKYNIITLDYTNKNIKYSKIISKKATIRYKDNIKSYILKKIKQNEELIIFNYDENSKYTKVRTKEGIVGYIKTKNINIIKEDKNNLNKSITKEENTSRTETNIEGKINLVWDNITNIKASKLNKKMETHIGVNVLSPTWLSFNTKTLDGEIINLCTKSYVDWAHKNNYKVWVLLSDNENSSVTSKILSNGDKREKAILNILEICKKYNIDGINIDFERVPQSHINYFLQFLRELAPILKEEKIIISVDTFVPTLWSMYYNRAEIGRIVDYVFVMTYDENSSIDKSGPNASIQFVEKGIKDTIFEVPSKKVIMCIPFYVRIWKEKEQEEEIIYSSRSVGMDYAYNLLLKENAEIKWLEDMKLYYGEFEKEENKEKVLYRIWIEDKNSIKEKLKLVKKYNLAGVASWSRGLEGEGIFETINDNLN